MSTAALGAPRSLERSGHEKFLFVACFVSLVATSVAFVIRGFVIGELGRTFNLSPTQQGEIIGAGFWPFGISIVLFSLIIDRVGYGKSMIFAFLCHVASVALTIFATSYEHLYLGACLCGLAAGTIEAVINPAVATMFPNSKTKMLSVLHAAWPGGIVLGGIIILSMGEAKTLDIGSWTVQAWQAKVALLLAPTIAYGLLMLRAKFPVNERVAAGVPYRDMLKEAGALGALIVLYMIMKEIGRVVLTHIAILNQKAFPVFSIPLTWVDVIVYGVIIVSVVSYLIYTRSLGRAMYIFLLLVMIMLAITELGTDGWISELRDPAMRKLGMKGGWILIYTATLMMILRFIIGPIVKVLKPLGVLLGGSLFAAAGLYLLSDASAAWWILLTATIYGIGQAYFWPVTLGVVAERFPKGGALTINAIGGMGMLGVGIIGGPLLGWIQDSSIEKNLKNETAIYSKYIDTPKTSFLGEYRPLNAEQVKLLKDKVDLAGRPDAGKPDKDYRDLVARSYKPFAQAKKIENPSLEQMIQVLAEKDMIISGAGLDAAKADLAKITEAQTIGKQDAMKQIALLPVIMALCYIGLIIYFRTKGGYKAVELTANGETEVVPTLRRELADEAATPSE
ncbi:MAG: MFS transporter [Planctomycetaceae bacterium]|nr:MFS transporter [Planctomycetaceae bacterium]